MSISVQLYTVRDAIADDLPGTMRRLAEIGFTQVEPYNFVALADDLARAFADTGLTAPTAHAPLPAGDPFTMLTEIDATLGTQSPIWVCDAQGNAPAQPAATVRGRNTFVSVFAFSIDPNAGAESYTVTAGGNLIGAASWLVVGSATAPDCGDPADPSDDVPGAVTYAPFPTTPQAFTCVLSVDIIPAPGAAALLGLGGLLAARRRR